MKTRLLTVLALTGTMIFSSARAQKTTFGLRGGISFQNLTGRDNNGYSYTNNMAARFHAGVNVTIPVAEDFYVRPELMYAGKGAKSPSGNQYTLNYIEVPVNLLYEPVMGNGRLMLGFGPYAAFGVGGKVAFTDGSADNVKFQDNVSVPAPRTAYYKQTDAGLNVLAGYDFGRWSLQLNGQQGLVNIYPEFNGVRSNASLKNSGFGISAGIKL